MPTTRRGVRSRIRRNRGFSIDDIILCEYASTVVSLELKRSLAEEEASSKRLRSDVEDAIGALSATERLAIKSVFDELFAEEGLIIASRIAKDTGITRSVIVNALKKLEGAGIIAIKSAGVKGTHIEVLNQDLYDAVDAMEQTE